MTEKQLIRSLTILDGGFEKPMRLSKQIPGRPYFNERMARIRKKVKL